MYIKPIIFIIVSVLLHFFSTLYRNPAIQIMNLDDRIYNANNIKILIIWIEKNEIVLLSNIYIYLSFKQKTLLFV